MATLDQLWQSSEESTIDSLACAENEIQTPSDFFMKSRPPQTFCVDFVVDVFLFYFCTFERLSFPAHKIVLRSV